MQYSWSYTFNWTFKTTKKVFYTSSLYVTQWKQKCFSPLCRLGVLICHAKHQLGVLGWEHQPPQRSLVPDSGCSTTLFRDERQRGRIPALNEWGPLGWTWVSISSQTDTWHSLSPSLSFTHFHCKQGPHTPTEKSFCQARWLHGVCHSQFASLISSCLRLGIFGVRGEPL